MAIYRNIQMTFWSDSKVVDNFTPEDKYFFLYLMTNPHTNLCGCYEISLSQVAYETGYNREAVERLFVRLDEIHKVIKYSKSTKEVLILNWSKYNWTRSGDFQKPLLKELESIKNADFKEFLENELDSLGTVIGGSKDPVRTTDTVTDTVTENKNINIIKDIINYLNTVTESRYKYTTDKTQKLINGRLNDGFTFEDFKTVIDKKHEDWKGTEWEKFLRPETLFGNKFEGYLNQKITTKKETGTDWGTIH